MNHCVPDFEMADDYQIPTSSNSARSKKWAMPEDEIVELLWQNGQVVMQSQTQRPLKKSTPSKFDDAALPADLATAKEIRSSHEQQHLFMQEEEMASWLHYPLNDINFDHNFCSDLLYPSTACVTTATANTTATTISTIAPPVRAFQNLEARPHLTVSSVTATVTASRPPIPPAKKVEVVSNFAHFSRHRERSVLEPGSSNSKSVMRETTVVDSNETPAVRSESRISEAAVAMRTTAGVSSGGDNGCGTMSGGAAGQSSFLGEPGGGNGEMTTCEMTVTSSPGGSSASAGPPSHKPMVEDRKRKGRDAGEAECHSEDTEFESADPKKQVRASTSTKRSRAAEVHNLSERRRRDRINEKMRALQELIPRCNKSDKASMLDEAIEYLKSLQLQVQMMSMGCGMVPMMFPGVQQYMPPIGMGMGMGMGMDMGMNRPMMPFPNVLAGAPLSTPTALGPRFPMPAFHLPPVPAPDPSRIQSGNRSEPMLSSLGVQNPNQARLPNFADPYRQYLGQVPVPQVQIPVPQFLQNQAMAQPNTSNPSTNQGVENLDNHQAGK